MAPVISTALALNEMLIGRKYGGPPPTARLATCCITIADYRRQELVEYESWLLVHANGVACHRAHKKQP